MNTNLDAIYENGFFRPVNGVDVGLSDGDLVRLTVQPIAEANNKNVLELAASVYEGLSAETVTEIERIALDRTNFFSK